MGWTKPRLLFDGSNLHRDQALLIENGVVVEISQLSKIPDNCVVMKSDDIIAPGLFDVQVNGGGGVMLNNQPTPEGVRAIAMAHRNEGTAFMLPTVITDIPETTEKAAYAVLEQHGKNGVLGVHIEGPHINVAHKGTHNSKDIRPLDFRTFDLVEKLRAHQLPVLLTLAPELVKPGEIARLSQMGVIVSAGHTAATAEQTERALDEGLRSFTHLFNGMPQMTSRNPGVVVAAINSDVWCGIIADGFHVDDRVLALAINARPSPNKMVLVSDAMSTIGGPNHFEIYGEKISVKNGRLVNSEGSLAGAHIDLKTSVKHLVNNIGLDLAQALRMSTSSPRDMMRLPQQTIIGSKVEDLARLQKF